MMQNPDTENFESSILASEYGIAKSVLSNLTCKDLMKASLVCQLWHDAAKYLFTKRTCIHWDFYFEIKRKHAAIAVDNFLDNFSSNIVSRPKLCVCITNARHILGNTKEEILRTTKKDTKWTSISTSLPWSDFLIVSAPGMIGTSVDGKIHELEDKAGFTILSLPDFPNVAISPFTLNRTQINNGIKLMKSRGDLLNLVGLDQNLGLPQNSKPKALLLFSTSQLYSFVGTFAEKFSSTFEETVAIGGGFVDLSLTLPGPMFGPVTGIVFSGDGVEAASIVITSQQHGEVEEKIKELKVAGLPEDKSICFMFACVGRGYHMFGRENFESQIFKKYFPQTPLFGFFGHGEIGTDYFPKVSDSSEKRLKISREFVHGYCTILVFLSFKKKYGFNSTEIFFPPRIKHLDNSILV